MSRNRLSTANFTGELQYGGVGMKTWCSAVLDAYGESRHLLAELLWEPPTPYPNDGNEYVWDETTTSWVLV